MKIGLQFAMPTDLPTGSLVVPSEFVQHDVDTTAVGDTIGLVSTVNRVEFSPPGSQSTAWRH